VLLAGVLEVPLVEPIVRLVTRAPRAESVTIAGIPTEIVRPGGHGPWPALLFVTGAHPERRQEPVVQRVSRGLARAGFLVAVPDLPGLGEGEVTTATYRSATAVALQVADLPDVRKGRVAVAGASTGAGIALVLAGDERLRQRTSVVCAVVPYARVDSILRLATTASYAEGGERDVTALLRRTVGRSLCAALAGGPDRERLLGPLRTVADDDTDPLRSLDPVVVETENGAAVKRILVNRDPLLFDELLEALPAEIHAVLDELSPESAAALVSCPVEFLVPPNDPYFPIEEARLLASRVPAGRLTVTSLLDHTRPSLSLRSHRDLRAFLSWTRRCLAEASS
jgi:pimeloyl-ACP methyl ester carboxylesterase